MPCQTFSSKTDNAGVLGKPDKQGFNKCGAIQDLHAGKAKLPAPKTAKLYKNARRFINTSLNDFSSINISQIQTVFIIRHALCKKSECWGIWTLLESHKNLIRI
jgi:hypothetical protein